MIDAAGNKIPTETVPPEPVRWHPYADLFPWIEGQAFRELVEDVRRNGILEPIVFLDGAVLDGRNRYMAARELGIAYPRVEYDGTDPLGFVIAKNLKRRHLTESQRGLVAAKLANLSRGGDRRSEAFDQTANLRTDQAAGLLNVSPRTVETARKVVHDGAPELVAAVESGSMSVSVAADIATLPKEEQREVVTLSDAEVMARSKVIRAARAEERRAARVERLVEISKGNSPLVTDRRYPIIYADPPWRYEHPPMGGNRVIENHYPTMTLDEICALPVADLCTEDSVLFMWATAPKLAECFQVIAAWGFDYRTCAVWIKDKIGMGYYVRNQHELLLIAKRGNPPMPHESDRSSSVISAVRGEHSVKPVEFYELIERMYPELPKIELFCRSPREGWAVWGNQAEAA